MNRYEQGSIGMRPDKEGAWCAYEDVCKIEKQVADEQRKNQTKLIGIQHLQDECSAMFNQTQEQKRQIMQLERSLDNERKKNMHLLNVLKALYTNPNDANVEDMVLNAFIQQKQEVSQSTLKADFNDLPEYFAPIGQPDDTKDAARYRWLRRNLNNEDVLTDLYHNAGVTPTPEEFGLAIDTAMAAEKEGKNVERKC